VRVVLDTNTLVSGVISPGGPPRRLLDGIRAQAFELCSSATLLAELLDVLSREKFAARLTEAGLLPQGIVTELRRLAYMVTPQEVPRVIEHDADDDHVLACALAGRADMIVSGDRHLHSLGGQYQGIPIVTAAQAVQQIRT
jgi:putative PIN family toxin of toxin-antitoxin system